jgi:hypothetical protein
MFSNEKDSANKENVSPLSGGNVWIASGNSQVKSGGRAMGSTPSGGTAATIASTPIQNRLGGLMFHNSCS